MGIERSYIVIYLAYEKNKNLEKCKFLGQIINLESDEIEILRLSPPDKFIKPEECRYVTVDKVCSDDIVHIIISKVQDYYKNKTLEVLNSIDRAKCEEIKMLIAELFVTLESKGVDPWRYGKYLEIANRNGFAYDDYVKFCESYDK